MEYLDFELEIGSGARPHYPLAVLRSPAGEAREAMRFPFDELALENRLQALEIALLRSGGTRRRIATTQEQTVQDFGQRLFDALLSGEVRSRYNVSLQESVRQGKGLRLKLRIQPPELASLPWEFLYDERRAEYVVLSRETPLVRYIELPQPIQPLAVDAPLRILGMIASPRDQTPLDTERERQRVEKAIGNLQAKGLIALTWLPGQGWQHLQLAMRGGPWHVFHFIGHGGFDPTRDEGFMALANEEGLTHHLSATQLARLLASHRPLRLVILNSCEGARGGKRDIFSSTAAILIRRGIPAVVAMQYEITDGAAIEFARAFYESVAEGLPVDAAVAEARTAISIGVANTMEWGTPVLYTRAPDGVLFDLTKVEESAETVFDRLRKAAGHGDVDAQNKLGEIYYEGRGVPQSYAEAAKWFRKAAGQGNGRAQAHLGWMYLQGIGVAQSDTEAVEWIRKAVEQGNAAAQSAFGLMYQMGRGVPQSDTEAVKWFRRAAEQGDAAAQFGLGMAYLQARGVSQSFSEAVKWLRRAAESRVPSAQYALGMAYLNGRGVSQSDAEAVKWLEKAAEQGVASAQYELGTMYYQGRGVPQNDTVAVKWSRMAAEQGHADAQYALGTMYYNGRGVPENDTEAAEWFRKAAEQGHAAAREALTTLRKEGTNPGKQQKEELAEPIYDLPPTGRGPYEGMPVEQLRAELQKVAKDLQTGERIDGEVNIIDVDALWEILTELLPRLGFSDQMIDQLRETSADEVVRWLAAQGLVSLG